MNTFAKAKILGSAGHFDSCGPKMCEVHVNSGLGGIYYAKAEHKTCKIFKTLMDNNCSYDCKYCANSSGCTKNKASYEPQELAGLFNHLHNELDVNGLFISSAISGNPDAVSEKMIEAVEIVRKKYGFKDYIHFKVLPGTSYDLIKQASELSNRMSINLEAPNKSVLNELSSCKDYHNDILKRQAWISKLSLGSGQATQMIISEHSTDKEVLKMTNWEYDTLKLKRIYYSAFQPVKGTPFENKAPESLSRQNRLYNSDFLLRDYNFNIKELYSIMDDGMLPKEDPKLALAKANLDSPLDINEADYEELIRIPGIGPITAKKILEKVVPITKYEELDTLGATVEKAKPFISVNGKRQMRIGEFT
ncbi:MAG: radical SAM protein [archaeon]